jgi:hypothetical protein
MVGFGVNICNRGFRTTIIVKMCQYVLIPTKRKEAIYRTVQVPFVKFLYDASSMFSIPLPQQNESDTYR